MVVFILVLSVFIIQWILVLVFRNRSKFVLQSEGLTIDRISVIIPFHNEALRLGKLLNSLNNQRGFSDRLELIFVDDHSTDDSSNFITSQLKIPHKIIRSEKAKGKKNALHHGILAAQHDYILTLDADVELPEYYFENLLKTNCSDLIILPVEMSGKSFFQELASIEFRWLQLLTFGAKKPTLCNGANLLFSKQSYLSVHQHRSDFDITSGDDIFLQQAMLKSGKKVVRLNAENLSVKTDAPASLTELLHQRKRWIGKLKRIATVDNAVQIIFLLLIQVAFFYSVIAAFFFPIFWIPVLLKISSEFFAEYNEERADNKYFFLALFIHQFWYPVYLVLLLFPVKGDARWG